MIISTIKNLFLYIFGLIISFLTILFCRLNFCFLLRYFWILILIWFLIIFIEYFIFYMIRIIQLIPLSYWNFIFLVLRVNRWLLSHHLIISLILYSFIYYLTFVPKSSRFLLFIIIWLISKNNFFLYNIIKFISFILRIYISFLWILLLKFFWI